MNFGVLGFARLSDLPEGIVVKTDEVVIHGSLLLQKVEERSPEFRDELKKNLLYVLEKELSNKLLLAQAFREGYPKESSEDQTIQSFMNSKAPVSSVSDGEAKAFYENNRDWLGNMSFEQVAGAVKDYLLDLKRQEASEAYLLGLAQSKRIEIQSSWAEENCALAGDNPVDRARTSGKWTLVEFGATGCEACDRMEPVLRNLEERYFEKVNIVFVHIRHFPFLASRFRVTTIPVQVFFDQTGKEVFRHVGFYPQNDIEKKLAEMGAN